MARRYSRIKRGFEYDQAQQKLNDWEKQKMINPQNKTYIGGVVENPNPRKLGTVIPFGTVTALDTEAIVSVSINSHDKMGANIATRLHTSAEKLAAGTRLKGFTPAKVHYFEPTVDTGGVPYAKSKVTGMQYVKREGKSYTLPFGATSKDEEEQAGASDVKKIILNINTAKDYRRVWISAERIQI